MPDSFGVIVKFDYVYSALSAFYLGYDGLVIAHFLGNFCLKQASPLSGIGQKFSKNLAFTGVDRFRHRLLAINAKMPYAKIAYGHG